MSTRRKFRTKAFLGAALLVGAATACEPAPPPVPPYGTILDGIDAAECAAQKARVVVQGIAGTPYTHHFSGPGSPVGVVEGDQHGPTGAGYWLDYRMAGGDCRVAIAVYLRGMPADPPTLIK